METETTVARDLRAELLFRLEKHTRRLRGLAADEEPVLAGARGARALERCENYVLNARGLVDDDHDAGVRVEAGDVLALGRALPRNEPAVVPDEICKTELEAVR